MSETIQAARAIIEAYDRDKEPDLLRQAGEQLERADLFAPRSAPERIEARTRTLNAWLMILSRVDAAKGAEPGPDDQPASRVAPPVVPGRFYRPGMDPKDIDEPEARAAYEKAIAENQAKIERSRVYWIWEAIDIEVTGGARRFVSRFYTSAPPDQKELREAIAAEGIGERRARQLETPERAPK